MRAGRRLPRPSLCTANRGAGWTRLGAAVSSGKWPQPRTASRVQALTLSIAFAEQITLWLSVPKEGKGTNSVQASSHSFTIARYMLSHASANS